jgi:thiamine kinase-like enzyme
MTNVAPYLQRIPVFEGVAVDELDVERLGGLTNLVFRVGHRGVDYLLRIPGPGTADYIDRAAEAHDARVAAAAGVSAAVLFFDIDDGLMLAEYLDGTTLDGERFRDLGSVRRAARALRRMHAHPEPFAGRFDVFAKIDEYLALLDRLGAPLPPAYDEVKQEADAVRRVLEDRPASLCPCHCDPLAENFIDDGERVWIVDWEYAGNNDPMWDLGDLSVEAGFDDRQDAALLQAYFDGEPPPDQVGRMVMAKMLCDLVWTLWGVIQHANGNPAEDFQAYATGRFERCKALLRSPGFVGHLQAIRASIG